MKQFRCANDVLAAEQNGFTVADAARLAFYYADLSIDVDEHGGRFEPETYAEFLAVRAILRRWLSDDGERFSDFATLERAEGGEV